MPVSATPTPITEAAIQISYREEGNGKGAFYDHWTLRQLTGHDTSISLPNGWSDTKLRGYVSTTKLSLTFNNPGFNATPPIVADNSHEEHGLLFIPGRVRATENQLPTQHHERSAHEQNIIKAALLRGRPILAVCAGSWQLWTALGGLLTEVSEHNYRGGMPRLPTVADQHITHNVMVHDVQVTNPSLLNTAMLSGTDTQKERKNNVPLPKISVNSVHWMAPNHSQPARLPNGSPNENVQVVATSCRNDAIAPNSAHHEGKMAPQTGSCEAFELSHGAPTLGVLWHPEAFNTMDRPVKTPKFQLGMLRFMAFAGDAYAAKQRMLQQYKNEKQSVLAKQCQTSTTADDNQLTSALRSLKI